MFDRPLPAAAYEEGGLRVIFQIPKFLRVPESRVVGEHFGLLFGSGTRDPGELRVTKVYISGFPLLFPFMEFSLGLCQKASKGFQQKGNSGSKWRLSFK